MDKKGDFLKTKKIIIVLLLIIVHTLSFSQDYWESIFEDEGLIFCSEINYLGYIYIGTQDAIYISFDNGISWDEVNLLGGCGSIISDMDTLYASMNNDIYISYDFGSTWEQTGFPSYPGTIFKDSQNNLFVGNWGEIYKSTDNGETWVLVLSNPNTELVSSFTETSEDLFAGTTDYMGNGNGGVYRSLDQGDNWEHIGLEYHFISSLLSNSNDEIFAGSRGHYNQGIAGVYRSSDNGETWDTLTNDFCVSSLALDSEERIFAGCTWYSGPVHFSEDNGQSWQLIESELLSPTTEVRFITVSQDDYVYAIQIGDFNDAVYRSVQPTTERDDFFIQEIQNVKLSNYPNPFNPSTTISFSIPDENRINLTIYNLKGQKVKTLVNDNLDKGNHSVVWNGKDLNNKPVCSGIYLYKIKAGNKGSVKRMILLK